MIRPQMAPPARVVYPQLEETAAQGLGGAVELATITRGCSICTNSGIVVGMRNKQPARA